MIHVFMIVWCCLNMYNIVESLANDVKKADNL